MALSFGGVQAIDGLDLEIRPGQVHGLIGPNGSGKTTTLNVISGYYAQQRGAVRLNGAALPVFARHRRAQMRIARTFQTPRIVGSASVLQNVMIGGTIDGEGTFVESLLSLPRHRRDEAMLRDTAMLALAAVGLERLAAGARRPVATQRVALHGDRSRVDAAPGFPAARRAGGRTSQPRRSGGSARCSWQSPGPAPACCWWSIMPI